MEAPNPIALPAKTSTERIDKALMLAVAFGGYDGAHHKDWVIDQMVRALTGCPVEKETIDVTGKPPYVHMQQGESQEYKVLIAAACAGDDGPNTYAWETGTPP